MSGIADSGPVAGSFMLAVLYAVGHLLVAGSKWLKERERKREEAKVQPTALPPPGPEADAAILARLRALEAHQEWTAAMDDLERQLAQARAEAANLAARLHVAEAACRVAHSQLAARDALLRRLRDQLASERVRHHGAAVEQVEAEYRDASQAGPLQDALPTPLRPGKPDR